MPDETMGTRSTIEFDFFNVVRRHDPSKLYSPGHLDKPNVARPRPDFCDRFLRGR